MIPLNILFMQIKMFKVIKRAGHTSLTNAINSIAQE